MNWRKDPCPFHGKVRCPRCRCPKCKRGYMVEWRVGWYCSNLYARQKRHRCDYEVGDPPMPPPRRKSSQKTAGGEMSHGA